GPGPATLPPWGVRSTIEADTGGRLVDRGGPTGSHIHRSFDAGGMSHLCRSGSRVAPVRAGRRHSRGPIGPGQVRARPGQGSTGPLYGHPRDAPRAGVGAARALASPASGRGACTVHNSITHPPSITIDLGFVTARAGTRRARSVRH